MRNEAHSYQPARTPFSTEKKTGPRPHRAWKSAMWRLVCLFTMLAPAYIGAYAADAHEGEGGIQGKSSLETIFPELELVRCLFREERLVVRYRGELRVLHSGDQLPDAGLNVVEAKNDRIVLQTVETNTLPSGIALPKAMVVLSRGPDGQVSIQAFSSEPPDGATPFVSPQSAAASATTPRKGSGTEPAALEPASSGTETQRREAGDRPR